VQKLRAVLFKRIGSDAGMSLVELMVAMVIFAIVSVGILTGMLTILKLTRDSRAVQVASNLAAEEIDLARSADDLFALDSKTYPVRTINGDKFTIKRVADWVTDPNTVLQCGAGGAPLRYKAISVTVTWENMSPGNAVQSYTVLNPAERINDPTKGTIIVSVLGVTGAGSSAVSVNATPATPAGGATTIPVTPTPTDSKGCTYVLKVTPGNYNLTVTKTGFIDADQNIIGSNLVSVAAGSSVSRSFNYDKASTFPVSYATNAPSAKIPTNMDTTFISSYGLYYSAASTSALSRSLTLYPHPSGYEVIAGKFVPSTQPSSCPMVDPAAWPAVVEGATTYAAERAPASGAQPGAVAPTASVPMGIFKVKGDTDSNRRYIKAVSQNLSPACGTTMTYTFGSVLTNSTSTDVLLALPYGNWKLYYGSSTAQTTEVGASRITLGTGQRGTITSGTNVLSLDPRVAQ
jgi:prepilin-type N-terminal cleavage/methylation domain-containing protein